MVFTPLFAVMLTVAAATYASDEELRQIDHPLLMVYGDQDATGTVQTWQRFVALMPNAEIEVLEEAGHVPWLDNPDSVSAAIKGFLSRR